MVRSLPRLATVAFALVLAACGSKSPPAAEPEPQPEPATDEPATGEPPALACDRDCADSCMADQYQVPCIEDCGCDPDEVLNSGEE